MSNTVLAIVYEAYQFNVFFQLFQKLAGERKYNFIMYSPYYLPNTEQYIQLCTRDGFHYIYSTTKYGGDAGVLDQIDNLSINLNNVCVTKNKSNQFLRTYLILKNKFRELARLPVTRFKKILLYLLKKLDDLDLHKKITKEILEFIDYYTDTSYKINSIIDKINPSLLLFTEDVVERDSNIWIKIAQKKGILSAILSSSTATVTEAAETYFNNPHYYFPTHLPLYLQIGLKIFIRKWCFNYRDRKFIRLPLKQLIAMDLLDLAPKQPWTINSGDSTLILVESQFSKDLLVKEGINRRRIKIIGSLKFDSMAPVLNDSTRYKQELYQKYNLNLTKKLILCAFPPNLPNRLSYDFQNYEDMTKKWISTLQLSDYNVLYSVHPSGFPDTANAIRSLDQIVVEEDIANLIPLCDVYLASVSSTIKWARACNKLVLDYDCFHFNYRTYEKDPAIIAVKSLNELKEWITRLNNQSVSKIHDQLNPSLHPNYWGIIDGRSLWRINNYIDCLIK
ncbi:Uncharacterised protein [Legionella pneumophila]|uniref:CDP-Glycerol:Poly(Glycerophosphate) glycerophosphotransferase n=19 Tax=Legionella pneumophila TaxID=446 RepID=A0AAV2UVY6_LEGPN|nr:hypothetical protein [Legionella pneumophila]ANN91838.1 hypothetical protein A9P85_04085 [Legionella pneumophila]MCH9059308.1 hypothetical protein [Legionella pneumophila serogroup 1]MCH9063722.1 hypothetical protein [Legionella pneumophila serogroup 1]MCH9067389.1 hypothetical protein [Legionella pneumophila serogroup 1]MCH9070185.1 hypothetical protein [Legionella pneumophila serogroup 1]